MIEEVTIGCIDLTEMRWLSQGIHRGGKTHKPSRVYQVWHNQSIHTTTVSYECALLIGDLIAHRLGIVAEDITIETMPPDERVVYSMSLSLGLCHDTARPYRSDRVIFVVSGYAASQPAQVPPSARFFATFSPSAGAEQRSIWLGNGILI